MFFMTKQQFNELTDKLDAIATGLDKIHTLYKMDKPVIKNGNGHKPELVKSDSPVSVPDAVMAVMADGKTRGNRTIMHEVNKRGTCNVRIKKEVIGTVLSKLNAEGKLERIGRGIYRAA